MKIVVHLVGFNLIINFITIGKVLNFIIETSNQGPPGNEKPDFRQHFIKIVGAVYLYELKLRFKNFSAKIGMVFKNYSKLSRVFISCVIGQNTSSD